MRKVWIILLFLTMSALIFLLKPWSKKSPASNNPEMGNFQEKSHAEVFRQDDKAIAPSKTSETITEKSVQIESGQASKGDDRPLYKKEECVACSMDGVQIQNETLSDFKIVDSSLKNITVTKTEMTGGSFYGSNMSGSTFEKLKTSDVKFTKADLTKSSFKGANLDSTFLSQAKLKGSEFSQSMIENSNFYQADLSEVSIVDSQFIGCEFGEANMDRMVAPLIVFDNSLFPHAKITNANLRNASFKGTNLYNVDFSGSDLSHANFFAARNFDTVKLDGANLCGAVKPDGMQFPCKKD
jgi:uncharacterized protein YjbI with pentapeptide repeats